MGNSRLVYSTSGNNTCPQCGKALNKCGCSDAETNRSPGDGIVRISRETKGRNGKAVTLVKGIGLAPADLRKLGKRLKSLCGSGGTVKDGVIEIQGDHRPLLKQQLEGMDFIVKLAG